MTSLLTLMKTALLTLPLRPAPVMPLLSARRHASQCMSAAGERMDDEVSDGFISAEEKLDAVAVKSYAFASLLGMEEDGELELRPFYQRGFKWSQKQSSMWIESMLRGYPCLPEITLLDTGEGYAVFDGQQRLTTTKLFIKGERAEHWKVTAPQRRANTGGTFALEGLPMLKSLEGKTYKDLTPKQQRQIKSTYDVRCAVIPDSWAMSDYIDFFKRIQGGGTPMTEQELRRAISRGPFTELLDRIADQKTADMPASKLLHKALGGSKLETDDVQELLLRFFALQCGPLRSFGKPSMSQAGLELMKRLNKARDANEITEIKKALETAMEVALIVFPEDSERFRRADPIDRDQPAHAIRRVFVPSDKVNKAVWDCVLFSFSKPERKTALIENARDVRAAFVDLMQTDEAFESISIKGTEARMAAFEARLAPLLSASSATATTRPVPTALRRELIEAARAAGQGCGICGQPLGNLDDLLHIDHKVARARGGATTRDNLHVVHKACNLKKGSSTFP
mmetsp:Transcript_32932/g.107647  ORF Transcript_32932/g.107647 Transcript_32932/m.107647 type:complete len:512 (+) Transcript_32932:3-1538(+)